MPAFNAESAPLNRPENPFPALQPANRTHRVRSTPKSPARVAPSPNTTTLRVVNPRTPTQLQDGSAHGERTA